MKVKQVDTWVAKYDRVALDGDSQWYRSGRYSLQRLYAPHFSIEFSMEQTRKIPHPSNSFEGTTSDGRVVLRDSRAALCCSRVVNTPRTFCNYLQLEVAVPLGSSWSTTQSAPSARVLLLGADRVLEVAAAAWIGSRAVSAGVSTPARSRPGKGRTPKKAPCLSHAAVR